MIWQRVKKGVKFDNLEICCLLYADDIMLMSDSEEDLKPCLILSTNDVINGVWELIMQNQIACILEKKEKTAATLCFIPVG